MRKLATIALLCVSPVLGAPLFPDVSDSHWAADAVRRLAAAGLIEGYPDGTFKGDRASSRFEVAMMVARVLQKMEAQQATFASKQDLALVRQLADALKEELSALGVRVENLETSVGLLDQRVTELERLTFYGSLEARAVAESFTNDGSNDNDNLRGGKGTKGVPYLNYNNAVGSNGPPPWRPQVQGVLPVVDYRNGRALVNGVGFTSVARLGLKYHIDEAQEAGVEFAAFTAQGNQIIDAYWGAPAPYLANPWTANNTAFGTLQGQNNVPWSRAVFDHAWYENKETKTRLTLGAFDTLRMDRFIYVGQGQNNAFGPARYPGFGLQLLGQWDLGADQDLKYELFGSRFGDGGNLYAGTNYTHLVFGGDLQYRLGRADLKLNYVRYYDESPEANGPLVGLENITNVAYVSSPGWTPTQWVNPPGYFAAQTQTSSFVAPGAYVPNQVDTRPIGGWNGFADNTVGITSGAGNFGSQAQTTYGLSAHYWLPLGDEKEKDRVTFTGEYAHSEYKANRNSGYISNGNMGRLELGAALLDGSLDMSLQAIRVDPNYNPALFNAALLGIRFPRTYNFVGRYNLYDNGAYPHNREGLGFKGSYHWDEFTLGWKAGFYQQTETSLYDVRVPGNAFAPLVPTNDVIGFSPGFFDPVFSGFAHPNIYGANSGNSFDAALNPLENPRGRAQEYGLNFRYKLDEPKLTIDVAAERNVWRRDSVLSPLFGGSQNQVDLKSDYGLLGFNWGFQSDWNLRTGAEVVHVFGHHDPGGLYNGFALASGQTNFRNVDSVQTIPFVGLDHQLSKTSSISVDFRYYTTRDNVDSAIFAGAGPGAIGQTQHPFSWSGPQVSTYYKLTF